MKVYVSPECFSDQCCEPFDLDGRVSPQVLMVMEMDTHIVLYCCGKLVCARAGNDVVVGHF
jgi:hypothetical protein